MSCEAAALACGFLAWGRPILRWLLGGPRRGALPGPFALALGLGLAGSGVLGFGVTGLLRRPLPEVACIGLILPGAWWALRRLDRRRRAWSSSFSLRPAFVLVAAIVVWYAAMMVTDLLAPESFWDVIVYHLGVPARWMERHRIAAGEPFFGESPLLMSALYFLGFVWQGESLARMISLLCWGLRGWGVWTIARRWMTGRDALVASWLAAGAPLAVLCGLHAGSDIGMAAFGVLAMAAWLRGAPRWPRRDVRGGWLLLAGVSAGLAASTKWPGLAVPLVLALLSVPLGREARWFVYGVFPPLMPWMAKAYLLMGDPFFPLGGFAWTSPFWREFSVRSYLDDLLGVRDETDLGRALGSWLHRGVLDRFRLGLLGPAPLIAVASLLAGGLLARGAVPPLLFCAALGVLWATSVPAFRFFLPGLALLPVLIRPADRSRWRRLVMAAAIGLNMLWLPRVLDEVDRPWCSARGSCARTQYYRAVLLHASLDATTFVSKGLWPGPVRRTLTVGEVRTFLAPPW
ncbi:MAG: glycosyltransferase family 39 protein, partial [bacterium]